MRLDKNSEEFMLSDELWLHKLATSSVHVDDWIHYRRVRDETTYYNKTGLNNQNMLVFETDILGFTSESDYKQTKCRRPVMPKFTPVFSNKS